MTADDIFDAEPLRLQKSPYMEGFLQSKTVVLFVTSILLVAAVGAFWVAMNYDDLFHPQVSFDELRDSESERNDELPSTFIVSDQSPFYPLIATPVSVHYEKSGDKTAYPLTVVNPQEPSTAVQSFFESADGSFDRVSTMGDVGNMRDIPVKTDASFTGSSRQISLDVATAFWDSSDGVMLIHDSQEGYELGVAAVPVASYLNIPVIVTDKVSEVDDVLDDLDVSYSIVVGEKEDLSYKQIYHISSEEDARELTIKVVEKRLEQSINYIAMANPMDAYSGEVLDSVSYFFEGDVEDGATGSAANPGGEGQEAPTFYFEVPKDYEWAKVTVDTKMELSNFNQPLYHSSIVGDRIYTYVGTDRDEDGVIINDEDSPEDELDFYTVSLAHGYFYNKTEHKWYGHSQTFRPMFKDTGTHSVQVLASLPSEQYFMGAGMGDGKAYFRIEITVEKMKSPIIPLMPQLSSMAPYLAAYRTGVVLSEPEYRIHTPDYTCQLDCSEPDTSEVLMEEANHRATQVKKDLNLLLGELANMPGESEEDWLALAEHYYGENGQRLGEDPTYLGIIADTNMIPWFYYAGGYPAYEPFEGYGIPGDNFYIDIDSATPESNPSIPPFNVVGDDPRMELAAGRLTGWDSQDVSALLARTFFYYDIIDSFEGNLGGSWKDSAMTSFGTEPPVETTISAQYKLDLMWADSGFGVDTSRVNELSRREFTTEIPPGFDLHTYEIYEQSNYIFFSAHGFFYWYVPAAQESLVAEGGNIIKGTGAGSAFDVAHVKDMDMGPSVIFGSSCVTGKIDGIPGRDALSQAFLHAGFNSYVGASRLSYGSLVPLPDPNSDEHLGNYLACLMYAYSSGGVFYDKEAGEINMPYADCSMGASLAQAKNVFVENKGADPGGAGYITYIEFNLMGDPAFNPYEPANG